jgi:hypothetical protein
MRFAAGVLAAAAFCAQAHGAEPRWTTAFAQGTVENIIRNGQGASLNIYCPSGQIPSTPGMFIESKKLSPSAQEKLDVRIVVDGRSRAFVFDEIQFQAVGQANRNALAALIDALVKSKSRSFVVEVPKFGMSERFSLSNARRVFTSAREFLDGCNSETKETP